MNDDTPKLTRRGRIVMCKGPYCNANHRAEKNAEILIPILDELNAGDVTQRLTLSFSGCMSMCGAGPNWIIPPDEIICHHVNDAAEIQRIVDEYLRD